MILAARRVSGIAPSLVTTLFPNVRCVFLDRDGVIGRKPPEGVYVGKWSDFHLLPGVEAAIAALNHSGRRVLLVSNQRGVALGLYTSADVEALHQRLQQHLALHNARIDGYYFCPHDEGQCECRKPKTGLFRQAFLDFPGVSAANSVLIGDSISDVEAARALGMKCIFIAGDPQTQKAGASKAAALADAAAGSLAEAVREYLS